MKYHGIFGIILLLALALPARGQTLEILHSFNFIEGGYPLAALIEGRDGNLYGTTSGGGASNVGTAFRITTNGTFNSLVSFKGTDGAYPKAELVEGSDGNFYGTTDSGGTNYYKEGTVFRLTTNGVLTSLFSISESNGSFPQAGLVQWKDGNLFGTTLAGSFADLGTIFKITTNGAFTTIVRFAGTNGSYPYGGLMLGSDDFFYGTTSAGGANNLGTIFRLTPSGILTTLFSFGGADGKHPEERLVEGIDGNFYGTTYQGGAIGNGTVFKITPSGTLTTLVSFGGTNTLVGNPRSGLILAKDGNFYGTVSGNANGVYTVFIFRTTADGQFETLCMLNGGDESGDGSAKLMQARDGDLYGVGNGGGTNNSGTIFRIVMPVTLNSRVSGDDLILSWPTNALGFRLQSSADLNSLTNWIDSTNAPGIVGAHFMVTNNFSANAQFYRLRNP